MGKYDKIEDKTGFYFNPTKETLKLACCDCGLVHYYGITVENKEHIFIGFQKDKRSTAQLRRHKYGNLQQGKSTRYRLVDGRKDV